MKRPSTERPTLSILIPVYNERKTIRQIIEKVRSIDFGAPTELIIVDDGSRDGTSDELAAMPVISDVSIYHHVKNAGKGSAIQTALRYARGEYVVIQDADLELEPHDILPLFAAVRTGRTEVCYGSRFMGDCRHLLGLPTYWANRFLTLVCNLLNGQHLTDMNTCYKMMRLEVARRINLVSRGFAMEPEITTKLGRMGVRIVERPIGYKPRTSAEGKKIRPFDLVRYLAAMIRFRFFPDRKPREPVAVRSGGSRDEKDVSDTPLLPAAQFA